MSVATWITMLLFFLCIRIQLCFWFYSSMEAPWKTIGLKIKERKHSTALAVLFLLCLLFDYLHGCIHVPCHIPNVLFDQACKLCWPLRVLFSNTRMQRSFRRFQTAQVTTLVYAFCHSLCCPARSSQTTIARCLDLLYILLI